MIPARQTQSLEQRCELGHGVGCDGRHVGDSGSVCEQFGGIAAEATATGVGFGEPVEGGFVGWVEVDAVFQDCLHGAVLGVAGRSRPGDPARTAAARPNPQETAGGGADEG